MSQGQTSRRKLLLWDIDGTLLFGDHAGENALKESLRRAFGVEGSLAGTELAGRTDRHIADQLLRAHGIEPTPQGIHDLCEAYIAALEEELPRRNARLLPGVVAALEAVAARPDLAQGLLTGNLRRGAQLKLERFDTWRFFPFGAFGDDSPDRNELGHHALRRARAHHDHPFEPELTYVIGDTPHDVACGRAVGARTIAVATGRHSFDELAACRPTAVLRDLTDTSAFLAVVDQPV
jgi:phosphoglycolate phosphatase-like HAD superfamily hydrolase